MSKLKAEKLLMVLNTKWKNKTCIMCGGVNWSVSDKVFELREFHGGSIVIGGSDIFPVVPVTCTNCGNTIFVNPMIIESLNNEGESVIES